jgi:hypothetical protein
MNDVTKATGLMAYFKREIEPRAIELADLMAERQGKKRIRIPVTIPIEVSGDSKEIKLWKTNVYIGGGVYKEKIGRTRVELYIPEWEI